MLTRSCLGCLTWLVAAIFLVAALVVFGLASPAASPDMATPIPDGMFVTVDPDEIAQIEARETYEACESQVYGANSYQFGRCRFVYPGS